MKNYVISGTIAAVIALAAVFAFSGNTPVPVINDTLGAVSGPDDSFTCKTTNGVQTCSFGQKFNTASTTLCSFKTPNATTSVSMALASVTTGTTTALLYEWGKSTVPDATTTSLGTVAAAGTLSTLPTIVASTTQGHFASGTLLDSPWIVAPNTYVNLKYGKSLCSGGTCNALVGQCDYAITVPSAN